MKFRRSASKIYKLPNRKKKLITEEFLKTYKEEIDKRIDKSKFSEETYWGLYFRLESTNELYDAFRVACEKHNITRGLYNYSKSLCKEKLEIFEDIIIAIMVEKGVIVEGNIYDGIPDYKNDEMNSFKLVEREEKYKGYTVKKSEWTIQEKGIIENILNE